MAHEITIRQNGFAEMAYVGEVPWHGLGQSLERGATIEHWAQQAGLNWTACVGKIQAEGPFGDAVDFPEYKGLYRSDTNAPLAVVGSRYQVVQPMAVLEFFRSLIEGDGWWLHTAGSLNGGRRVWAMASRGEDSQLGKGDVIQNHLLLATSMDGSMRTTVQQTSVRVVCANTLALSLRSGDASRTFAISHRSAFDGDEIKKSMGLQADEFSRFMRRMQILSQKGIGVKEATEVLERVMYGNKPKVKVGWLAPTLSEALQRASDPQMDEQGFGSRTIPQILGLFQGHGRGSDLRTAKGTMFGLLNAVTEYVDHYSGRTDNGRLDSAWFGKGAELKTNTYRALNELALEGF